MCLTAIWPEGDSCLTLKEDGCLSSSTHHHGDATPTGMCTNHDRKEEDDNDDNDDENDENGETAVVQTPSASEHQVSHEKPLFPRLTPTAGAAGPLVLPVPGDEAREQVPHTINRYLRDYQREGIRFIHGNYAQSRGCVLGDDMGLGKTVQVVQIACLFLCVQGFRLLLLYFLCALTPLLFILVGHWLSQCCASQDRHLGGHREQQASIPPDSVGIRAEETQQGRAAETNQPNATKVSLAITCVYAMYTFDYAVSMLHISICKALPPQMIPINTSKVEMMD